MKQCTKCGARVEAAALTDTIKLAGVRFSGTVAGWRCTGCSTVYDDGPDLERFEQAAVARLLDAGIHTAETVRFARKALGFRATDLGRLLDVRPETISRWETGEREPEARAVALLGALVLERLEGSDQNERRLQAMREPQKLPKSVDLDEFRQQVRDQLRATTDRLMGTDEKRRALRTIEVRKRRAG